ncbi:hypothetical protein HEK616_83360 (plasmid) [Streptomyces nigrescens]|uniref:Helicase-associated domain-containing protein n=1 Tax=Streptomyces nigrescens TaxID=1920 RepID=A0ABM8A866_STRNI|nr:hypothetical protein HEK616_83360 [Streptomyces nigrescens]
MGVTKDFPLGRWVHQQRKALRAGELEPRRKTLLDAPEAGMVWEPGEEAWETKLAALRSYRQATGHLAPRQDAVWGEGEALVPIGQHLANLRRKGGLARTRSGPLCARSSWRRSMRTGTVPDRWTGSATTASWRIWSTPTASSPGCSSMATTSGGGWHGSGRRAPGRSCGKSSSSDCPRWASSPFRRRLPPRRRSVRPRGPGKAQQAFQRGLAALAQWVAREGDRPVPRGHSEEIALSGEGDGEPEATVVKLGVWISNTRARRENLTTEQRAALAALGVQWARPAPAQAAGQR